MNPINQIKITLQRRRNTCFREEIYLRTEHSNPRSASIGFNGNGLQHAASSGTDLLCDVTTNPSNLFFRLCYCRIRSRFVFLCLLPSPASSHWCTFVAKYNFTYLCLSLQLHSSRSEKYIQVTIAIASSTFSSTSFAARRELIS